MNWDMLTVAAAVVVINILLPVIIQAEIKVTLSQIRCSGTVQQQCHLSGVATSLWSPSLTKVELD